MRALVGGPIKINKIKNKLFCSFPNSEGNRVANFNGRCMQMERDAPTHGNYMKWQHRNWRAHEEPLLLFDLPKAFDKLGSSR